MKKAVVFIFAALMGFGAAARAAEVDFDGAKSGGLDAFLDVAEIISDLAADKPHHPPKPPYPGHPGHPGYPPKPPKPPYPPQPPYHPPHNPPYHPPAPPYHPPHNPPSPPPPQYHFGGYERTCRTLTFTAQSPLSVTEELFLREYGQECQSFHYGGPSHCRPSTKYHSRKVTVDIGPRQLENWETERLELCMETPHHVTADTSGMAYNYSVSSRNEDGWLGFKRRTVFTLTPLGKKPSHPDSKELAVVVAGLSPAGDFRLLVRDNRSGYFRGEKITITAEGMRLPENVQGLPAEDLLNAFAKFEVTRAFDVADTYELRLMDAPRPGRYMLTLKFFRTGPLSSGVTASSMEMIEIR